MKTITVLAFICIIGISAFGQSEEYQIVDSLKTKISNSLFDSGEINVFPIETINANCKKYEVVEVKDSVYEAKLLQINSFNIDKIELTARQEAFKEGYQELINAKSYLDEFIQDPEPTLMFKWQYLKKAQESLDKTSHKIDLYRSKEDVFGKSGGKTSFKVDNYVRKQRGQIDSILYEGSYFSGKIEYLSKKIEVGKNELTKINKTRKVNMLTGVMTRTIQKVDSFNIGKEIRGRFVKEEGYAVISQDYRHFLANELILADSLRNYVKGIEANRIAGICDQNNYVIKEIDTGKLYYTTGDILRRWCMDSKLIELFSSIDKLNIKRQTIDDKILLSYNGFQCVLTADISDALISNDPTCINTMHSSVNKYYEYNKLASELALKLSNHIKLYKSRLIRDEGIETWKKDTKACDAILTKMIRLPYADSRDYSQQLDRKQVELHIVIMDYVAYSKNKLGL